MEIWLKQVPAFWYDRDLPSPAQTLTRCFMNPFAQNLLATLTASAISVAWLVAIGQTVSGQDASGLDVVIERKT